MECDERYKVQYVTDLNHVKLYWYIIWYIMINSIIHRAIQLKFIICKYFWLIYNYFR